MWMRGGCVGFMTGRTHGAESLRVAAEPTAQYEQGLGEKRPTARSFLPEAAIELTSVQRPAFGRQFVNLPSGSITEARLLTGFPPTLLKPRP